MSIYTLSRLPEEVRTELTNSLGDLPDSLKIEVWRQYESEKIADHFDNAATVKAVRDEYFGGNSWAWCAVEVRVEVGSLTASEYLGGCNYASEADFLTGGYFTDMVKACVESLRMEVTFAAKALGWTIAD